MTRQKFFALSLITLTALSSVSSTASMQAETLHSSSKVSKTTLHNAVQLHAQPANTDIAAYRASQRASAPAMPTLPAMQSGIPIVAGLKSGVNVTLAGIK